VSSCELARLGSARFCPARLGLARLGLGPVRLGLGSGSARLGLGSARPLAGLGLGWARARLGPTARVVLCPRWPKWLFPDVRAGRARTFIKEPLGAPSSQRGANYTSESCGFT